MKNVSAKVDVIVASPEFKADLDRQVQEAVATITSTAREPEQVDVAPDPHRRTIVLAPTKAEGYEEARALGIEPVAVITPRSLDAARGIAADALMEASNLTPEVRETLLPHAQLSLATTHEAGA